MCLTLLGSNQPSHKQNHPDTYLDLLSDKRFQLKIETNGSAVFEVLREPNYVGLVGFKTDNGALVF